MGQIWLFPPRLLEQLERLQRAVCRSAIPPAPFTAHAAAPALVPFSVEACLSAPLPSAQKEPDLAARLCALPGEQPRHNPSLNWQRRRKNPFASEWERIRCWVRDHPTGCARDLFQELQHLSPGRYHLNSLCATCSVSLWWMVRVPLRTIHHKETRSAAGVASASKDEKARKMCP